MFGVSRERVRQWRLHLALIGRRSDVHHTHTRGWDDALGSFRALTPEEARVRARTQRAQLATEEGRRRVEGIRERTVRCLCALKERLNGVPTRAQIAAELRMTISALAAIWREPSDTTPYRDAFRRWYAAAGVPDRRSRRRPAFSPRTVEALRRAHDRGTQTITELAWRYRVSYSCVWRLLRKRRRRVASKPH